MSIIDLFFKRKKRVEKAGQPDVYQYSILPAEFRIQTVYICVDMIGEGVFDGQYHPMDLITPVKVRHELIYRWLLDIREDFFRECGSGFPNNRESPFSTLQTILLEDKDIDRVLSLIELIFQRLDREIRDFNHYQRHNFRIKLSADEAIDELNHRFREHGIGYQFEGGQLVRMDSVYIHAEAIKPAVYLLADSNFTGALEEFNRSHEHFRKGNHKEAITEANKAFESTMKTICDRKKWTVDPNASASQLIKVLTDNQLIPTFMSDFYGGGLVKVLGSGVPTMRNKNSGHGQGSTPITIPEHYVVLTLNLTASNIVFLINAYRALR